MELTSFQKIYRGTIALNNYGVALLGRQCFQQAQTTLQNATQSMKHLFPLHRNEGVLSDFSTDIEIFTKQAESQLADPKVSLQASARFIRALTCASYDASTPYSQSVSTIDDDPAMPTAIVLHPLRIDDFIGENYWCGDGDERMDEVELNLAIILYNLALVHLGRSCFPSCTEDRPGSSRPLSPLQAHATVRKLLELSNAILAKLAEAPCRFDDFYFQRRLACVDAMVMQTLLHLLVDQREQQLRLASSEATMLGEICHIHERLNELHSTIQAIDEVYGSPLVRSSAPAA